MIDFIRVELWILPKNGGKLINPSGLGDMGSDLVDLALLQGSARQISQGDLRHRLLDLRRCSYWRNCLRGHRLPDGQEAGKTGPVKPGAGPEPLLQGLGLDYAAPPGDTAIAVRLSLQFES